jgi:D-threo-aldose 1-dehydrogenase
MEQAYGYAVAEDTAAEALDVLLDGPLNYVDTGANYGDGRSEQRIGAALARGHGAQALIVTKVDRHAETGVFDADQVYRSIEESLERLGLDTVPLLHLHDPEHVGFEATMQPGGAVEAMVRLRDQGVATSIGVAGGPATMLERYVATGIFDVVQTHNRFTLLDRSAEHLLEVAYDRGIGVVNAAPYGGGLLSGNPRSVGRYGYRPASTALQAAAEAMAAACARYAVPLAAAALQFSTREPRITTTIVGMSRPQRLAETLALLAAPIPAALWSELETLTPSKAEWRND